MDISACANALKRYKINKNKVSSVEEARTRRAVERKINQKDQRNKSLAGFRRGLISTPQVGNYGGGLETPTTSLLSKTEALLRTTKKEREEQGKARYQEMLKWKIKKTKQLEKEKKSRKPPFTTGLYQADTPKFLVSESDNLIHNRITPLKSASKNSSYKSLSTPGMPARSSGKFYASKTLVFHTGITPHITDNRQHMKASGQEMRNRSTVRPRVSRIFRPPPKDLEPNTGSSTLEIDRIIKMEFETESSSFAPSNFTFQAPEGLNTFNFNNKLERDVWADMKPTTETEQNEVCWGVGNDLKPLVEIVDEHCSVGSSDIMKQTVESESCQNEVEHSFADNSSKIKPIAEIEQSLVFPGKVKKDNISASLINDADENLCEYNAEEAHLPSNSESQGFNTPDTNKIPICSSLVVHAGATPGPASALKKRRTRTGPITSLLCNGNDFLTPPHLKLRPRTSCSRSTRRSKSVHCDHFSLDSLTNSSKKSAKKNRKSEVTTETPKLDYDSINEAPKSISEELATPTLNAGLEDSSVFKTPVPSLSNKKGRRAKVSWMIEASPWITKSRGSSSNNRKTKSVFGNDLELMFSEIPLISPVPPMVLNDSKTDDENSTQMDNSKDEQKRILKIKPLINVEAYYQENATPKSSPLQHPQVESEMIALIQPSDKLMQEATPDNVWGASSVENTPANEHPENTTPMFATMKQIQKCERSPLLDISPTVTNLRNCKRSKRSFVSFAEDVEKNGYSQVKFPGTPVGRVSRPSMGLFSKINIDSPKSPACEYRGDLIQWDTPVFSPNGKKPNSKKMPRVSLLPALNPCYENREETTSGKTDLISWETPVRLSVVGGSDAVKEQKNSTLSTPLRRSKRLSTMTSGQE